MDSYCAGKLLIQLCLAPIGISQRDLKRGNLWELAQMKKHPDGKIWPVRDCVESWNELNPAPNLF
jgi:hypothetical protein